jgi:hypothetical protein
LKKYYQSSKRLNEILKTMHFNETQTYQILVKDYWKPIGENSEKKVPIIIFPDITSPACNILE